MKKSVIGFGKTEEFKYKDDLELYNYDGYKVILVDEGNGSYRGKTYIDGELDSSKIIKSEDSLREFFMDHRGDFGEDFNTIYKKALNYISELLDSKTVEFRDDLLLNLIIQGIENINEEIKITYEYKGPTLLELSMNYYGRISIITVEILDDGILSFHRNGIGYDLEGNMGRLIFLAIVETAMQNGREVHITVDEYRPPQTEKSYDKTVSVESIIITKLCKYLKNITHEGNGFYRIKFCPNMRNDIDELRYDKSILTTILWEELMDMNFKLLTTKPDTVQQFIVAKGEIVSDKISSLNHFAFNSSLAKANYEYYERLNNDFNHIESKYGIHIRLFVQTSYFGTEPSRIGRLTKGEDVYYFILEGY